MPNNDNAHAVRLVESIRQMDASLAAEFEAGHRLGKSADIERKFAWASDACRFLEEHFAPDEIIALRRRRRCNDGKSIANTLAKYLKRAASTREFVELFNQGETFASLEYVSENSMLFCYPQCYCACVKRVPRELSKTWCYCALGNAEGIFEKLFNKKVKVTLRESIKSGGRRCAISVEW